MCDTDGTREVVPECLLHFLVKGSSAAALNARFHLEPALLSSTCKEKKGILRTPPEVENYLF